MKNKNLIIIIGIILACLSISYADYTNGTKEITSNYKFEEIYSEQLHPGIVRIIKDKETGIEYLLVRGNSEYSITPRLKKEVK